MITDQRETEVGDDLWRQVSRNKGGLLHLANLRQRSAILAVPSKVGNFGPLANYWHDIDL